MLNVTYPLVDAELVRFCQGKKAILIVEEGQPEFIEQAVNTVLRRADIQTKVHGKDMLPMAGEYTGAVMRDGFRAFVGRYRGDLLPEASPPSSDNRIKDAIAGVEGKVHGRPPSFCTGCPERPIFAAMKLVERELGSTTSDATSAAISSRSCHPSTSATPRWAMASEARALRRSMRRPTSVRSQ